MLKNKKQILNSIVIFLNTAFLSVLLCIYGSLKWIKINKRNIYIKNLDNNIDGLSILHISDLHSKSKFKVHLDIWKKIDKLQFDIVVITGDIILNDINEINPHLKYIKELAENYPVYYVDGNHERHFYYELSNKLKEAGVKVLNNEKVAEIYNDKEFEIIGLRDFCYLKKNDFYVVEKLFNKKSNSKFCLVLEHQPQIFDIIKDYNFNLVLAGHTHGGQVKFPFIRILYAPGQGLFPKYGYGVYENGNSKKMFVSKGLGATTFPIRFFNRPELNIIKILKEK